MGYRRLLKKYLQHVDRVLGSTLIETVVESELFNKRDVGELSCIAAELSREKANLESAPEVDYSALLVQVIRGYGLTVEEVAECSKIATTTLNQWCYSERGSGITPPSSAECSQVILAILRWRGQQRANAENPQQQASPAEQTAGSP